MKLNLNFNFKNLSGEAMENNNAGQLLGAKLAQATTGDAIKFNGWAVNLWNGKEINIDKSDQKKLRDFVENHTEITNLAKAQILECIDKGKE